MMLRRHPARINYTSLDFVRLPPGTNGKPPAPSLVGNIHQCNLAAVPSGSFDAVTAFNVFEHLADPQLAAQEMRRIVADGGLLITLTPWLWRYHPYPLDFHRYTHTGMRYTFERRGGVRTLHTSYAKKGRTRKGRYGDGSDEPPDAQQAELEQVDLLWIGVRDDAARFNASTLDVSAPFRGANIAAGLPIDE